MSPLPSSGRKKGAAGLTAAIGALMILSGCVTPSAGSDGLYASPIGTAPVTANPTAYTPALNCLAAYAQTHGVPAPRIAVGRILDYTGRIDEEGGRRITQGASLMAITAFAKAGARLVERFDTSVTELELRYANNRLIGQDGASEDDQVRRVYAGQIPGSDYHFIGGVTELNYNIRSVGADAYVGDVAPRGDRGSLGGRLFVMNIGLDFRLVDTRTLEVVDVIAYQKQIIGREVRAGVFSFFGDTIVDLGVGERALEPIQLAVRAGVERAVAEVMATLYGAPDSSACSAALAVNGDPMGPSQTTGSFTTANGAAAAHAAARRASDNAWHEDRDAALVALRGRSDAPPEPSPARGLPPALASASPNAAPQPRPF